MKEMLFKNDEANWIKTAVQHYYGVNSVPSRRICGKLERAEKKIKTSSAKKKGRRLQYWVCERIAGMFGTEFVQSDDTCLIHSREMGQHGTDVCLRGELYDKFPFDIECKAQESLSISDWVRQARDNTRGGRRWLVVFKKQTIGGEPLVLMDWSTFEFLIKKNQCENTLIF